MPSIYPEVEIKELKRTIRLVARNLGTHHITGGKYFEKFHSDLGLPPQYLEMQDIWDQIKNNLVWQGRNHRIAGVILYSPHRETIH